MARATQILQKTPAESKPFNFDFSDTLPSGVTITNVTHTVPSGLTKIAETSSGTTSQVVISGGVALERYEIKASITTSAGHTREATGVLFVSES